MYTTGSLEVTFMCNFNNGRTYLFWEVVPVRYIGGIQYTSQDNGPAQRAGKPLGIIPSSQLSNSIHALEQKLELQSQQEADLYEKVGRTVAAYAIFRGLQVYYGGSA